MSYFLRLFKGRLERTEYWFGYLVLVVTLLPFTSISPLNKLIEIPVFKLLVLSYMFLFIFSLSIRRLHDLNKSGWLSLLLAIPIVDFFVALYIGFWAGDMGTNNFGKPVNKTLSIFKRVFTILQ